MRRTVIWSVLATGVLTISASAPVPQPVTLNGRPFPTVAPYVVRLPAPRRTFFVAVAKENGDGSESHPWNDLQAALCALTPGDQLRVKAGTYSGNYRIDEKCRDGTTAKPIAVIFDSKAMVIAGSSGPSLTIRRSNWDVQGFFVKLGESPNSGIVIEGSSVIVDRARIQDGAGAGVRISAGARDVTISNSRVAKANVEHPTTDSVGIEVTAGARHVVIANNHVYNNPAGSIRVGEARDVEIVGNTIRISGSAEITVDGAENVRIVDNTIEEEPGQSRTYGIALEQVNHAIVRSNHISNPSVAVAVGRVETNGGVSLAANEVTIDHNHIETASPAGVALSIEAGNRVLFANNVVDGYADGILLLGNSPLTRHVIIANNLVLGVSATAFVISDPSVTRLFDFNVFSPTDDAIKVEVGAESLTLARFLERGRMPNTRQVRGVHLLERDLGRVAGVETVDRGKRVGIAFKGRAPDLGVSER